MRAVRCTRFGPPELLEVQDVDDPVAGPGEVVVDVRACPVNITDLLVIANRYQHRQQPPFTPGGEVGGVVRSVGDGVSSFHVGDRVLAGGMSGGFAEQKIAPVTALTRIPDGFGIAPAACLTYSYGTVLHAFRHVARLRENETLLVLGAAGGVGLAGVEVGRRLGARVIAAASSPERLAVCADRGADHTIDYSAEDLTTRVRELTGGIGADVVLDPVGEPHAENAVRATALMGRYLVTGFAGGIPSLPLHRVLLRGCAVMGVFLGAYGDRHPEQVAAVHRQVRDWWLDGSIQPYIAGTYPLSATATALTHLAERKIIGKAVVDPSLQEPTEPAPS